MFTNLNLTDMEIVIKHLRPESFSQSPSKSSVLGLSPRSRRKSHGCVGAVYEVGISYYGRTYEEGKKSAGRME